jgi:hypothetical protein
MKRREFITLHNAPWQCGGRVTAQSARPAAGARDENPVDAQIRTRKSPHAPENATV